MKFSSRAKDAGGTNSSSANAPGPPPSDAAPPGAALPGAAAQDSVETRARAASQVQHLSHLARALSSEKQFLRAALDSTEDALIAFDVNGRFVLCNRGFEQLFGLSAGDLAGRDEAWLRSHLAPHLKAPDDFFQAPPAPQTEHPPYQATVEWAPQTDQAGAQAPGAQAPDAKASDAQPQSAVQRRVLRWYSGPVHDAEGQLAGHIATQRDITRETEVDAMKTDFIAIVSHELRTPMTSIKGYVDLILDGDTGEINHLQREFLWTVQRNTRRLVAMINDMLDISRIESGNIEFDVRPFSLRDVIEQALNTIKPQADEKNLAIEVEWPAGAGPGRVLGDFDRVLQVLLNLLSNAIKYTPAPPASPGRITVTMSAVSSAAPDVAANDETPAAPRGRRVAPAFARIAVRDTGIGISPHDQALLFQKFFRADNSVTHEIGGTGLGLSITQALVEKMGGEIAVSSQLGEGSEFAFTLPLANAPRRHQSRAVANAALDKSQAAPRAPRVLVVDDDPDVVDLISLYLQRNGYDTTVAYSGPEALRLLDEDSFDIVTLDLLMPRMDGFTVLRHLQENPATRDLPVVIVSVSNAPPSSDDTVQDALRLGAYDFISKPLDETRLHSTLARALAARSADEMQAEGAITADDDQRTITGLAAQPASAPHAVIVDNNGALTGEIAALLQAQGARVTTLATPAAALAEATESPVDLIVLNPLSWGDQTLQLVEALREVKGGAPFLLFTEPNADGQYVLSRLSAHAPHHAPANAPAGATADATANETADAPRALRDICARLDEILHRRMPANPR